PQNDDCEQTADVIGRRKTAIGWRQHGSGLDKNSVWKNFTCRGTLPSNRTGSCGSCYPLDDKKAIVQKEDGPKKTQEFWTLDILSGRELAIRVLGFLGTVPVCGRVIFDAAPSSRGANPVWVLPAM